MLPASNRTITSHSASIASLCAITSILRPLKPSRHPPDGLLGLWVDGAGNFVQQHNPSILHQSPRQAEQLELTGRKRQVRHFRVEQASHLSVVAERGYRGIALFAVGASPALQEMSRRVGQHIHSVQDVDESGILDL